MCKTAKELFEKHEFFGSTDSEKPLASIVKPVTRFPEPMPEEFLSDDSTNLARVAYRLRKIEGNLGMIG